MRKRAGVARQYGDGNMGLNADYSNVEEVAISLGWHDEWFQAPAPKRSKAALPKQIPHADIMQLLSAASISA